MAILQEALEVGSQYFYIRTFLDEKEVHPLLEKICKMSEDDKQMRELLPAYYLQQFQTSEPIPNEIISLLTTREQEVYSLLADGLTNREIAGKLFLSEGTVRVYVSTIYSKLGVDSRSKAILLKFE
ncbi:helix-turn-helix domain-containing protein [Sporosarcina cascadiensis]|uniref:helix-turn-helix domain-containing protein n=1 Tax=Sporosarcina cascadiensis TaxID=2660747 RepID=UPI001E2FCC83|nr:response regulator transcription factor [Sporosarcina cascadiensis]